MICCSKRAAQVSPETARMFGADRTARDAFWLNRIALYLFV
jgi:hypothetical protein